VTTNVEPEEAKAIADLVAPAVADAPAPVAPRDFASPRRLSAVRLAQLARSVQDCLPALAAEVLASLRLEATLELSDLGELDCRSLFDSVDFPATVLCFRRQTDDGAGLPGWAVLDGPAAVRAADCVLGAGMQGDSAARALTNVEQALMRGFLERVLALLATALEVEVGAQHLAQSADEVASQAAPDQASDTARLYIHLQVTGGGLDTLLRFYLPLAPANEAPEDESPPPPLAPVFGTVSVDLGVYLGSVDIPLQDLLALEHGDVIPLGVEADEPLRVYVEDRPCATARWGQHSGKLAIQIEGLGLAEDDYHQLGLQQSQTESKS
jgi:flagellar motor switch protein FliM